MFRGVFIEEVSMRRTAVSALVAVVVIMGGCSHEQEPGRDVGTMKKESADTMAKTHEQVFTDTSFGAETSKGVVLVDFWAPWCGPCQMQGPIIAKVASAMAGKATVGKCNVDEAPKSADQFGVRSIPTLLVLKEGKEVERFVGVQSEATLVAVLKKHVK